MLVLKSLGLCVCVWVCVSLHSSRGQLRERVWVQDLWCSTLLNSSLFDCALDCSNYLSPRQISQEGPDQSVSMGFWFISRDTAVTCAILTLEYCVLNGPEVQIEYWISREKLRSAFKNKDGKWWPCGEIQFQTKAFGAIWGALRYQTCPFGAGKHSPGCMGNFPLAWKPGTHWAILWWLQPQ